MCNSKILDILKHNQGFDNPEDWIEYARLHGFKKVGAKKRTECPDCGETRFRIIGQYVYYSQLIRIKKCRNCKLKFSDVIIEKEIIIEHFERAYKDDDYFEYGRNPVFKHIADVLLRNYPEKMSIMDVGGATGHMASILLKSNGNYKITVNDISQKACAMATSHFNVKSICCSLEELYKYNCQVDILLLIDILYYVEDIKMAWHSMSKCINDKGIMLIRIPNKLWWIEIFQEVKKICIKRKLDDKISMINSEHVYFFSHSYLSRKLTELGFKDINYSPSPLTNSKNQYKNILFKIMYIFSNIIYYITFKRICLTPSQIVIARK